MASRMDSYILILILFLACAQADARTCTAGIEFKIRSNLSDITTFGNVADVLDFSGRNEFLAGERQGAVDQVYRSDRTVGTASADVLGLVGSLTNALGESVSFETVKALYLSETGGAGTLTVSGLATATIPPYGSLALVGAMTVASISDHISITTTATTTYRVWIAGQE